MPCLGLLIMFGRATLVSVGLSFPCDILRENLGETGKGNDVLEQVGFNLQKVIGWVSENRDGVLTGLVAAAIVGIVTLAWKGLRGSSQKIEVTVKQEPDKVVSEPEPDPEPEKVEEKPNPIHNLPFLSIRDKFMGRDLEALRADLEKGATAITQVPVALHGLGGIGKTRFAVEYAWRFMERYTHVLFVVTESPETLNRELAGLVGILGLPSEKSADEKAKKEAVLAWLGREKEWLLILDNVDTDKAMSAVLEILPLLNRGHVLITSRKSNWAHLNVRALERLPLDTAREFLLSRTKDNRNKKEDDWEKAEVLAEKVGGLPLGLEQAGTYICKNGIGFDAYLAAWEERNAQVLEWFDKNVMQYPASVATTWVTSLDEIGAGGRAILRLASFLTPEPIPASVFKAGSDCLKRAVTSMYKEMGREPCDVDVNEAVGDLADYSMVVHEKGRITLHRLVRAVVQNRIPSRGKANWKRWCVEIVARGVIEDPDFWPLVVKSEGMRFDVFEKAIGIDERNSLAYSNRGSVFVEQKEYEKAILDFNKAIDIDPQKAEAYINRGLSKGLLGRHSEAFLDYDEAIEINPQYATAYYNRGIAKSELGQVAEAIADYDKAIDLNPQHATAYYNRGIAKSELGQVAEAIADYDKAIDLNPQHATAYNNRGNAKYELGQVAEAIADYDKAIDLNPQHATAYYNRGNAKYELGQVAEAIADYDKAIDLNPQHATAYYNRGIAKSELGQVAEAIADYDKAIDLNPQDATAYNNRGIAKKNLGQVAEAIADYDKAIDLNPQYATAYYNRGIAKSELGQVAEAIADYDKAIDLNPQDATAYYGRGHSLKSLGKVSEAIKSFELFLKYAVNDQSLKDWIPRAENILKELKTEK